MGTSLKSDIYAEMDPFGTFDTFTGGELSRNVTDYVPGGENKARKIPSRTYAYSDIVITRAWDPEQDSQVVDWVNRVVVQGIDDPKTVVKYTKNKQGTIVDAKSYMVTPKAMKTPDGMHGDDSIAEFSVTLSVEREL